MDIGRNDCARILAGGGSLAPEHVKDTDGDDGDEVATRSESVAVWGPGRCEAKFVGKRSGCFRGLIEGR